MIGERIYRHVCVVAYEHVRGFYHLFYIGDGREDLVAVADVGYDRELADAFGDRFQFWCVDLVVHTDLGIVGRKVGGDRGFYVLVGVGD